MTETSPLEQVWEHREESIYPTWFGSTSRGTFVLSGELFTGVFSQENFDPRWLHYGVVEFAPTEERDSWLYVSSGASNPWELEPEEYSDSEISGFGTELVLEVPGQAEWAIVILQRILAFNILLAHGRYGDKLALDYGDRIPLRAPITLEGDSLIQNLVVTKPTHYGDHFILESGRVDFLHLVGTTDRENDFAKNHGSLELCDRLLASGYAPITQPDRPELSGI